MSTIRSSILCLLLSFANPSLASESKLLPIMGAGPSTAVCTLFFKEFSKKSGAMGYRFNVEQRSIKHAGGIKATGTHLFGRTGRPLNKKEKAMGKDEIFLARIPLAFVVGKKTGVKKLTLNQLKDISTGKINNWKQVGGNDHAISFAGREPTEAAFSSMKKQYGFLENSKFHKIFRRDHQVVNYLKSDEGAHAISFGAKSNFGPIYLIKVDGFESGVDLGLVHDKKNKQHRLVKAARSYARSSEWLSLVRKSGFLAPSI